MKLPAFRKSSGGKSGAPADRPRPASGGKPASIARLRTQLLVSGIAIIGILSWVIFQYMSHYIARAIEQEVNVTTSQITARVGDMVRHYGDSVALLARDPDIAYLLKSGERTNIQEREESLRYVFPDAINVQLLPPGLDTVDDNRSPPLSYAALVQMQKAERGSDKPAAEVHLFNTPQQHVNIVRRVNDPASGGVLGHVMLSLSNDVLARSIGDLNGMGGYVELQQVGVKGKPVVIATFGDGSFKGREADLVMPVKGSLWQVAYWPVISSFVFLGKISLWVLIAVAVAAAALVALIVLLFRSVNRGLHDNQVSMVTLMKDASEGRVQREYPGGLAELEETVQFMIKIASKGQKNEPMKYAPAPREQDREYASQSTQPAPTADMAPAAAPATFGAVDTDPVSADPTNPEPLVVHEDHGQIDPTIFRAYDIRGVVDKSLTSHAATEIGRAIGSEALQRGRDTVVVGRDGRLSGPQLSSALIEGIVSTGCDVRDIGCVPTPVLYFATHYLDTHTGVIVTGSHNPPDYNGLKIVIDGETLSGESIQSLRERIDVQNYISGQGSVHTVNVVPDYMERVKGDVTLAKPLRIVVDCGNGVAGSIAPSLFRELGCEVTELYCQVDGNFPNHHPDPSKEENMADLIQAVRGEGADLGLAFDGDGDRLGVVTSNGEIVWPDRVLMLYVMDILSRNPGGQIIYDVKCTRFLDQLIREHGGQPLMWKTGHSFIKAKIKESGALLAGEMSGHIFIKERWYGFDDGIYAGARLLEILSADSRSSAEQFAELPDSVNTPELNVQMNEGEPPVFINSLLEQAHFDGATVSTIDGLRADFEDGWGLVRASNTTPVLVLRFEADNNEALARIMGEFRRVMVQVNPHLSLPF